MSIHREPYEYVIHLLKSVLDGKTPNELPEGISFPDVYSAAKSHHVANATFYAVEKLNQKPDAPLYQKWAQERDLMIMRDFNQTHELELMKKSFSENKIRHILLKGSVMKELYPISDIRYMCDVDMVIDPENANKVRDIMVKLGYGVKAFNQRNDDEYTKKPIMNVEIHNYIFSDASFVGQSFYKLFEKPFEVTEKLTDYTYVLNKTHFFLHLLTHTAKHYLNGGIGFRAFMDIYLFHNKYREEIDSKALDTALAKTKYSKLCKDFIEISYMWFGEKEYDSKFDEITEYIFKGGSFGTVTAQAETHVKEQGKLKFLLTNMFPNFSFMRMSYPILNKLPFLYPFMIIWRLITRPFSKGNKTKAKLKALFKK